jgi:hypothetical protein
MLVWAVRLDDQYGVSAETVLGLIEFQLQHEALLKNE